MFDHALEAFPLREGIEQHMIDRFEQFHHVSFRVARRERMDFAAEAFPSKPGFVGRTGATAVQRAFPAAGNDRENVPHGEAFQGHQDLRARAPLHFVQNRHVRTQLRLVHNEAGDGNRSGFNCSR